VQPAHLAGAHATRERIRQRSAQSSGPDIHRVDDLEIPSATGVIPARRYQSAADPSAGLIVYFHGGGWVVGGIAEADALCRTLATESGVDVVSVGYRLAPEHPFPAALDDADTATAWLAERHPAAPLVLLGDSAGGNLAAVVARRFRDRGNFRIALQVLVYPVTDHRMNTPSYAEHGGQLFISAEEMRWFWDQYVPDRAQRSSIDISPAFVTDLRGLPPAIVVVAGFDPIADEAAAYATRLAAAGVEVRVDRYESAAHGFFPLQEQLEVAREALGSICVSITRRLGPAPANPR
jgi:acetyl esterase